MTWDVVAGLQQMPRPLSVVTGAPADGGVPDERGLYAWWAPRDTLPGVDGPPHPDEDLELLYVVIEQLEPPLNQSENSAHPLYRYVRDARAPLARGGAESVIVGDRSPWATSPMSPSSGHVVGGNMVALRGSAVTCVDPLTFPHRSKA